MTPEQRAQAAPAIGRVYGAAEHLAFHLAEVPVMLFVCIKGPPSRGPGASARYGSIYPAVQNLLLAARGLGLGASLTTLHKGHEDDVKALLNIPENVETVALIPIGYPKGKYGPTTRRPIDDFTHYERWDSSKN